MVAPAVPLLMVKCIPWTKLPLSSNATESTWIGVAVAVDVAVAVAIIVGVSMVTLTPISPLVNNESHRVIHWPAFVMEDIGVQFDRLFRRKSLDRARHGLLHHGMNRRGSVCHVLCRFDAVGCQTIAIAPLSGHEKRLPSAYALSRAGSHYIVA